MKEQNQNEGTINNTTPGQENIISDFSTIDVKSFNRMKDLQTLIKKESALKELCKWKNLLIKINVYIIKNSF